MTSAQLRRFLPIVLGCLLLICCLQTAAFACPNCKDAMAQNDPTTSGLARGYGLSIMFMLSMPFLITAGLGTYFYLLVRQARKRALLAESIPTAVAVST